MPVERPDAPRGKLRVPLRIAALLLGALFVGGVLPPAAAPLADALAQIADAL